MNYGERQEEQMARLGDFLAKYEQYFLLVFLAIIGGKMLDVSFIGNLALIVLSLIACLYFFSAYAKLYADQAKEVTFFQKVAGLASAITLIGVLFEIQGWPGGKSMMGTAVFITAAGLPFGELARRKLEPLIEKDGYGKKKSNPAIRMMIRLAILLIIAATFRFVPKEKMVELGISSPEPIIEQELKVD
ncbi:hypothetical protein JYT74_00600 [Crocinitomix catalasitica]|nr:hypothetical protein [Crocinitomix catalasitica]